MQLYRLALLVSSVLTTTCQAFSPGMARKQIILPKGHPKHTTTTSLYVAGAQEAWTAYNDALQANPLLVKSVTAGVILGAADLAGQAFEQKENKAVDIARTARFAFFGLVLQAPWNHFYYMMLDGAIPPTPEPWTATTGIKVVIDQFVQAPVFTVLIFAFLGFLEGKSAAAIKAQLDEDYVDTMFANWKLWIPATVINIAFIKPELRVLYDNLIFLVWTIYLSTILNS
mmetsp:Transcript_72063/g.202227  ORF Transcript_72063/g.202227 Transcript_72063/m.202227 type:complete len:228 (-) Transcript_72063:151-834(-)